MILPSDKEYKETKQIMLGNSVMNPDFNELAYFIDQTFSVKTINIIYDTIDKVKQPRLNICFEFEWEKQSFNDDQYSFDAVKQKSIATKFQQILKEQKIVKEKGLFDFFTKSKNEKYKTNDIWVYYSAFEPIAKIEANENVPQAEVIQLKEKLNNKDIWEISRGFSETTFFVYTDQQIKQYENSPSRRIWADRYFDLLESYNEFGYFKRDNFAVYVDSKENFDFNYQSNWYYYYK